MQTRRSRSPTTSSSPTGCALMVTLPGLEPAHVEQVADQRVEPLGFVVDGLQQLLAGRWIPVDVVGEQARRRGSDRTRAACAGRD